MHDDTLLNMTMPQQTTDTSMLIYLLYPNFIHFITSSMFAGIFVVYYFTTLHKAIYTT